jgi:site-specific DNA-methyltransferase (adenine-specific)
MTTPYYADDLVTLYHGDCREVTAWLEADVLVTDPPYGIDYRSNRTKHEVVARSIVNDKDTTCRDVALAAWGAKPRIVFGSPGTPDLNGVKLVWHKPGSGMGDLAMPWKPDYEFIYAWGKGFIGSRDTSVLTYPLRVFRGDLEHPHQKPVDLLERLIAKCPPGTIADPFAGSGSTLVAAKQLGRRAIGVEIDERYCEIAARRLTQDTLFGEVPA